MMSPLNPNPNAGQSPSYINCEWVDNSRGGMIQNVPIRADSTLLQAYEQVTGNPHDGVTTLKVKSASDAAPSDVSSDYVIQEGDRIFVSPAKYAGA